MNRPLRLLIWSSIPTHHQSGFFSALRKRDIDLVVHYYFKVDTDRLDMGWSDPQLPAGERYVGESLRALDLCPDWRERTHVVPGYGVVFLVRLAWFLSRQRVPWLHWSEHSEPTLHSHITFLVKRAYGRLVRRHAIGALAIGELARLEFIRWGVDPEGIRFLPYAVPGVGGQLPQQAVRPDGAPRFLFLGQLIPRKGIDILLAAMKNVLAVHASARLEFAGTDRSGGAYAREAARLGISHAVQFSGMVEAPRVGDVLRRCDVFVLPSRHDGWGVVLNEAASAGKAIIASDTCGAAHHLVSPGVNGFRFPNGDVAALTRVMLEYCRDPQLAVRHGSESLRVFQEFTPERNALRFEEALDSLLESKALPTTVGDAAVRRAQ
jgi:glycosyltransferase involved in cell wall biosynthesis